MNPPIIFVVDDEPNNFDVIEALLLDKDYTLRFASSGQEAIDSLGEVKPDLILLDLSMPGMDGYAVCQKLKSLPQWQHIPIIMVTAVTSKQVLAKCMEIGADDFISKPVSGLELRARIRSMLRIRQQYLELSTFSIHLEATVQERTSQLRNMIAQDSLTKLPSRAYLLEQLGDYLATKSLILAVIILDCDQFNLVNGSFGHEFGDKLLVAIAQRLQKHRGTGDLLSRLGEDEFCWVVNSIQEATPIGIEPILQTISKCFQSPFLVEGCEIYITVSIGIAFNQEEGSTAEQLLQAADTAMYQAKLKGKASAQIFCPEMNQQVHERLTLETDLQRALKNDEFIPYYQPILDLKTLKIVGFEALIRWQHPEKGLIPPGRFIPSIETSGLIEPVGIIILQKACQQLHQWHQQGWPELTMSVNVSTRQFTSPRLLTDLDQVLRETQLNPSCLKLEITESTIMNPVEDAIALTKALQARQIQVSIDDFGTGYSSLQYLHCFAADNLKIDRSFISELNPEESYYPIVNTIFALAKELELSIIAEGIETPHQLEWLQGLGCEFGQGYYFAKPLPAAEIEHKYLNQPTLAQALTMP